MDLELISTLEGLPFSIRQVGNNIGDVSREAPELRQSEIAELTALRLTQSLLANHRRKIGDHLLLVGNTYNAHRLLTKSHNGDR